jgi:hypothetical protein
MPCGVIGSAEAGGLEKIPPKPDTGAGEFWYDNANGAVDTTKRSES